MRGECEKMIRKISKKLTSMIMVLTMVLSYVMPITTVFAATTITVNVTATDIVAHVKITSSADPENPGPFSKECLTTDTDPGMQAVRCRLLGMN